MERICRSEGVRLMRMWGNDIWPDVEADYRLWGGCCVFAIMPLGDGNQFHMAMMPSERRRCREAMADVIRLIGDKPMLAPILLGRTSAENLAKKFGFVMTTKAITDQGEVSCYVRSPKWAEFLRQSETL